MLPGYPESAICVQRFDDSLSSAIHITYRNWLRSSSMHEPRDPPLEVVIKFLFRDAESDAYWRIKSTIGIHKLVAQAGPIKQVNCHHRLKPKQSMLLRCLRYPACLIQFTVACASKRVDENTSIR